MSGQINGSKTYFERVCLLCFENSTCVFGRPVVFYELRIQPFCYFCVSKTVAPVVILSPLWTFLKCYGWKTTIFDHRIYNRTVDLVYSLDLTFISFLCLSVLYTVSAHSCCILAAASIVLSSDGRLGSRRTKLPCLKDLHRGTFAPGPAMAKGRESCARFCRCHWHPTAAWVPRTCRSRAQTQERL